MEFFYLEEKGSVVFSCLQDELEVKLAVAPERIEAGGSQCGDQFDAQVAAIGGGGVQRGTLASSRVRGAPGGGSVIRRINDTLLRENMAA